MAAKYNWRGAEVALQIAVAELNNALRHLRHRKRANVLNDLISAEAEMSKVVRELDRDIFTLKKTSGE